MARFTYYCPDCEGAGSVTVNSTNPCGYGPDPQCDEDAPCPNADCVDGFIESDDPDMDARRWSPSRRRWHNWTGIKPYNPQRDVLIRVAEGRSTNARVRFESMYDANRQWAMRPVALPQQVAA